MPMVTRRPAQRVSGVIGTTTGEIRLTWDDVPGATTYRIYRGTTTAMEDHYQTSSDNSFLDTGAVGTALAPPAASGTS